MSVPESDAIGGISLMPSENWGVAKVKGVEPEHFFIFLINTQGFKGPFMRTSDFLSEDELRSDLKFRGNTEEEILALIERARANPA
jgi:hypothetical protein